MRAVVLPFVPRDPAFQRINTATLGTELSLDLVEAPAPYGRPDDVRIKYAIKRAGNGAKAVRWYEFVYDGYELQVIRGALNGTPPGWFVEEPEEAPTEALFRPIIKLKGGALTENVDAAEANLLKADRKIFVYGEKIVRARLTHDIPIAKNRQATGTRLFEVGHHHLVESFTKTCAFYRFDKRAKKWHEVNCPGYIAATYMGRGDWRLPPLTAVINAPTLRPDGSILDKPGYDAETGILYEPLGVVFPSIPASPTRDEAIAALAELKAPIVGFPFVGGSDRSVALSGMLTAVVRPSLASAPLHGFDAPTPGSGKTKLASIPGVLVTGHEPSASNVGKAPEEVDKHLGSMLLCGDPVILLDNVTLLLDSALLCQILTQPRVTIRVLGKSEVRRCPTRTLVLATGNNLQLVGDLTRRCLVGRIDPQCEQPETREFAFDPTKVVEQKRPRLVQAALTVLWAFHVAGRPQQKVPLGSFEEWSRLVRDALIWCGEADPADTIERVRESDPQLSRLTQILALWSKLIGNERITVAEVIDIANVDRDKANFAHKKSGNLQDFTEFREALMEVAGVGNAVSSRRLGFWLRSNKDRMLNGVMLKYDGHREGTRTWRLVGEWR